MWTFDSLITVAGAMRQVWARPCPACPGELNVCLTFDTGHGENKPTAQSGYYTNLPAFLRDNPNFDPNRLCDLANY